MEDKAKKLLEERIRKERAREIASRDRQLREKLEQSMAGYGPFDSAAFLRDSEKKINEYIEKQTPIWQKLYEGIANVQALPKYIKPEVPAMTTFARTRTKVGNERINLNFFEDSRIRKLENFAKGTNIKTLKKMLRNTITEAQAQGAKNWTTRAQKFVKEFRGDKDDLIHTFKDRYFERLNQYIGDTYGKQYKRGFSIVKESGRLTKRGAVRKRYRKVDTYHAEEIRDIDNTRSRNIERAIWRLLKVDNSIRNFNREGWGTVSHYFMNSIAHFASLPGTGLGNLREEMFEHEETLGIQGGEMKYWVRLSEIGRRVLTSYFTEIKRNARSAITSKYETPFVDLRKMRKFKV